MAPIRRWNPTFTMLVALDDHEYADPALDREYPPPRNGLPEPRPYTYHGNDFSLDAGPAPVKPWRKPPRRHGPAAIDPGGPPVSAPLEWLQWLKYEEETP